MSPTTWWKQGIEKEFDNAALGDQRLGTRLATIAKRIDSDPAKSFPSLFEQGAELEGFYRFLRNESVNAHDVLRPHAQATLRRAESMGEVLAIHDTTDFVYRGQREGLGLVNTCSQGFFAHASLLVEPGEHRLPLGVGACKQYIRSRIKRHRTVPQQRSDPSNEGKRWWQAIEEIEKKSAGRFSVIHVADRDSDSFELMRSCIKKGYRFVIRARKARTLLGPSGKVGLEEAVCELKTRVVRQVHIAARPHKKLGQRSRFNPPRLARNVKLAIGARSITMSEPLAHRRGYSPLCLHVVRVWEVDVPKGEEPIEWMLWTNESIASQKDLERIVDIYRSRWLIEEFFKVLKTGCQLEKRQLESRTTLSVALSLFVPVAWRMLLARSIAQQSPNAHPRTVISALQLKILEAKYKKPLRTAADAFAAIARFGGHLKQNGPPGWLTLGRGFDKLYQLESLAQLFPEIKCDQS